MTIAPMALVVPVHGHTILGISSCTDTSFTIQVTNVPSGTLVAQILLVPTGEIILDTTFDVMAQTIVAVRPTNLVAGVYHLNLYLNGTWIADADVTICAVGGGGTGGAIAGGRTIGFWANKNGQALITSADLQALRDMSLRNGNGTEFNAMTKVSLSTWLRSASGKNMANMLSAQLTATYLSVQHGFTDANVVVDGSLTVSALITYANSLLVADGMTRAGDPNRAEQERVKDILDRINNGR